MDIGDGRIGIGEMCISRLFYLCYVLYVCYDRLATRLDCLTHAYYAIIRLLACGCMLGA